MMSSLRIIFKRRTRTQAAWEVRWRRLLQAYLETLDKEVRAKVLEHVRGELEERGLRDILGKRVGGVRMNEREREREREREKFEWIVTSCVQSMQD